MSDVQAYKLYQSGLQQIHCLRRCSSQGSLGFNSGRGKPCPENVISARPSRLTVARLCWSVRPPRLDLASGLLAEAAPQCAAPQLGQAGCRATADVGSVRETPRCSAETCAAAARGRLGAGAVKFVPSLWSVHCVRARFRCAPGRCPQTLLDVDVESAVQLLSAAPHCGSLGGARHLSSRDRISSRVSPG